jgi:excisionase family DNA binding protein
MPRCEHWSWNRSESTRTLPKASLTGFVEPLFRSLSVDLFIDADNGSHPGAEMSEQHERWITVAEASRRSGYSMTMIQKLLKSGRIKGIKPGHDWLTTLEAVLEYKRQAKRGRPPKSE